MAFWNKQIGSEREVLEPIFGSAGSIPSFGAGRERVSKTELVRRYGMMVHRCVSIKSQSAASVPYRLFAIGNPTTIAKAHTLGAQKIDKQTRAFCEGRCTVVPSAKARSKIRGNLNELMEITTHPLLELLNDVNEYTDGFSWRESLYADLDIFGSSYHALIRPNPNQPPTGVWRLMAQNVKVVPSPETFVKGFMYGNGVDQVEYEPSDVLWFKTFDPFDPLRGFGPLEAWIKTVDAEFSHASFIDWLYKRGGSPDYVVTAKNGMSADQRRTFRSEWKKLFSRLFNRQENVAILSGDGTITPLGRAPKELETVEQDAALRDKIAVAFGVPKSLITTDDVNLANAREGSITFMRNSIWPMIQRVEDTLNEHLVPLWSDRLVLMHDNPITEDRKILLEERSSLLRTGHSVDEVRLREGDEPLGTEWSTAPLLANDLMSLTDIGVPRDDTEVGPIVGEEEEIEAEIEDKAFDYITEMDECDHETKALDLPEPSEEFVDDIQSVFVKQGDEVIENLRNLRIPILSRNSFSQVIPETQIYGWMDQVIKVVTPHITALVEDGGQIALRELHEMGESEPKTVRDIITKMNIGEIHIKQPVVPQSPVFSVDNPLVRIFIADRSRKIGSSTTDRYRKGLRGILLKGLEDNLTPDQMATRMTRIKRDGKGVFNKANARRIARTETAYAAMNGAIMAWKDSGVVKGKRWILAPDACTYCRALIARTKNGAIGLEARFAGKGTTLIPVGGGRGMKIDYDDILGPPLHPYCRCDLAPVTA